MGAPDLFAYFVTNYWHCGVLIELFMALLKSCEMK